MVALPTRAAEKHRANVMACAAAEMWGERWDIWGASPEQERRIRREARELAAALSEAFAR